MTRQRKSKRKPRPAPVQARSRKTYGDILEAAARILVREGILAFSTNRVAEVSGVGVGSIYQYFRNKEEILETIAQRHIEEIRAVLGARAVPEPPGADMLDALIDGTLEAHLREPALHRAISEIPAAPAAYPRIAREKEKFESEVDLFLRSGIRQLCTTRDERRIRVAALIVYSLVETTIHRAVAEAKGAYDREILTTELKQAVRSYLETLR